MLGRNSSGVPITFITLSIEPNGFDSSVISFASNNGFDLAGLDLIESGGARTEIRNGFSYYSGEDAGLTPGQVNINDRRRFVILDGQPGPNQWTLRYINNDFSRRDTDAVLEAIDGISLADGEPVVDPSTLDSDSDGLSDAYESLHGLNPEDPADAILDLDNDGHSNIDEFLAQTSPSDPLSRLTITAILTGASEVGLRWTSVPGINYQLETTADLSSPGWHILATVTADAEETEMITGRDERRFYRVRAIPE